MSAKRLSSSGLFPALAASLACLAPSVARAVQFPTIDPNYNQQIYTTPLYTTTTPHEGGFAWTPAGNLITRTGSTLNEYSLSQNATVNATNVHSVINTYTPAGLDPSGVGMTNGLDGYIYTVTGTGLQRFSASNLAAPVQNLTGTAGGSGWGITTLPDGRIAYSNGAGGAVYLYTPNANPTLGTNALIYTGANLIDGMVAGPGGEIAVANQGAPSITVMSSVGTPIITFSTGTHYPDGLAFGSLANPYTIYANNNDGSITRYVFSTGYASLLNATDIAYTSGAYGDLAAVGPDCAFYVSQYENGSLHGSVAGVGTNWDNNTTTGQSTYIRISGITGASGGVPAEICDFYTPLEGAFAPEPASLALLGLGGLALLTRRSHRR